MTEEILQRIEENYRVKSKQTGDNEFDWQKPNTIRFTSKDKTNNYLMKWWLGSSLLFHGQDSVELIKLITYGKTINHRLLLDSTGNTEFIEDWMSDEGNKIAISKRLIQEGENILPECKRMEKLLKANILPDLVSENKTTLLKTLYTVGDPDDYFDCINIIIPIIEIKGKSCTSVIIQVRSEKGEVNKYWTVSKVNTKVPDKPLPVKINKEQLLNWEDIKNYAYN